MHANALRMDACVDPQRFDVGIQGIQKITADPLCLPLIEAVSVNEIATCRRQNPDFSHRMSFSMRRFAASQFSNRSSPRAMAASRSASASACQAGG